MYKVLIIDDEEIIREGLIKTIDWEAIDCKIVGEAEDGDDGVKLINSLKPDIVLTDIRMPGLNGLDMISKIREMNIQCKILILTGFRDFEYAQEAVRLGAFRLLLKPTKDEEITLSVKDAINEIRKMKFDEVFVSNLKKKVKQYYGLNEGASPEAVKNESANTKNTKYLVCKALEYIKANYTKNLDLTTVANELFISTWHLSKLLKKETGSNFIDILNGIRIEEAKKLLINPKYKIYEVAEKVGFVDVPYFTKLFKKMSGLTPNEFKNTSL